MTTEHEQSLREAFVTLTNWLEPGQDCYVLVHGCIGDEHHLAGGFTPPDEPNDKPRIEIFRQAGELVPGPADDELATLAHETGHWRSWKLGERPEETRYRSANDRPTDQWPDLSADEKRMIVGEEIAAWRHGRDVLLEVVGDLPASFWDYYERRTTEGLGCYDQKLGIAPAS